MDMTAAARMAAEAEQLTGLINNIDTILKGLRRGDTWAGDDAIRFRKEWERKLDRLVKTRAQLFACADSLREDAKARQQDAAMMMGNPYAPRSAFVA